jgi:hypothetical protein
VTPTASPLPSATATPTAPLEQFTLLKPASTAEPTYGRTEFEWQWHGPLGPDQGFEVRVWREGEPPAGVHNALDSNQKGHDNQDGYVIALDNNTYRLVVDIRNMPGVLGRSGEYLWTVFLVQISPEYKDLGIQATPGHLRFEAGGGRTDHDVTKIQ